MMQVQLLNFGDNTRVVNDISNGPVSIGIGKLVECDIHDVHFHMIRRAIATETLMVVPKDVRKSARLVALMKLLEGLEVEPYDELLAGFNEVLPPPGLEEQAYRPTRDQMRLALREASRKEVAAALQLQSRVTIREEGDKVTRQEVPPPAPAKEIKTPEATTPPPKPKKAAAKAKAKAKPKAKAREKLPPAKQSSKPARQRERL